MCANVCVSIGAFVCVDKRGYVAVAGTRLRMCVRTCVRFSFCGPGSSVCSAPCIFAISVNACALVHGACVCECIHVLRVYVAYVRVQ